MVESTETYVRERIAKSVGQVIENCEKLIENCKQINSDEFGEEQLVLFDQALAQLAENLGRARLITIIGASVSGGKPTP